MEDTEKILQKLPEEVRDIGESNPEWIADKIRKELDRREKFWPTVDVVPNVAQERALMCYASAHATYPGKFPFIMISRGGNGVGKTMAMVLLLAGVTLGLDRVNKEYLNFEYFKDCEKIRFKRSIKIRIVCNKSDVLENGSVTQEVRKWIPTAEFRNRTSAGYYTEIRIPAPSFEYFDTVIDIKTSDMDVVAHAGPDYDIILFNEPPKQDIYNENVGRCRRGGRIALFLTPLDQAGYLSKIEGEYYPDGEMYVTEGSIWENCVDIPGTRGILAKSDIERMKRQWYANNPLEVPAREFGKYMHLSGAIYQIYNRNIHEVDPFVIPDNWNIYKIIDPHSSKPPFALWIAVNPMNECYVIAEYPVEQWNGISGTYLTIKNFVSDFERIQNGKHENFQFIRKPLKVYECLGDPNKFGCEESQSRKTLKQLYEWYGNESIITNIDDDVHARHEKVRQLLIYDPERKIDSMNHPMLYVFKSCKNTSSAFRGYKYAKKQGLAQSLSEKIDEEWACPMDCVGYFAMRFTGWQNTSYLNNDDYGDYDGFFENNDEVSTTKRYI
ncbi:MAG: hypothetical protein WC998_04615 [Candidatus Paceibacterota bacterium]